MIVSGWIEPYLTAFTTSKDPSLKLTEEEGSTFAKLTSSSFANRIDYEEVLNDARELVQLITGAMNVTQDPGTLKIVNVVGVYDDGTEEKYSPHGRPAIMRFGIPTRVRWAEGATPRPTLEQAMVLVARQSGNSLVADVLRFLALSPDWFGPYKALEVVKYDLNTLWGKRDGANVIVENGWATNDELDAFHINALHHRHWRREAPPKPMDLIDAR